MLPTSQHVATLVVDWKYCEVSFDMVRMLFSHYVSTLDTIMASSICRTY